MSEPTATDDPADSVLLATDLSARSDRALDRAAQLAEEWQATLVALNVLEPAAHPDQALAWMKGATDAQLMDVARKQLAEDLGPRKITATSSVVQGDDIASAIRSAARHLHARLVVTGVSSNEMLGRYLLGTTPENLARTLPAPLLVVRKRAHAPYRRIVVATDFSASSRHALLTAARLFPGRELVLYHAATPALSGMADAALPATAAAALDHTCAAFVAAAGLAPEVRVRPVIEHGAIESVLARHVREHDVELVVMGNRGASGVIGVLLGSTAAKCLDWLPCDILRVREPDAG